MSNFIRQIIDEDLRTKKNGDRVATRFPPEPNGYLHLGHAKSICLNFGIARDYKGICNLRLDDTNPEKESDEYVQSIRRDVQWLGFEWAAELYASDYFEQMYDFGAHLIQTGKAFVCDLTGDQVREMRGTLQAPGKPSPFRDRSAAENLDLFKRMRAGEFPDGSRTLRARIDMGSPNINLRDPVLYRIKRAHHHRTGDKWCIYPMYDYAHCISDALEGITHSICTLEFEDHRPLYDWILDHIPVKCHPQQIEFSRLNLDYTVMSKRRLLELVETRVVQGWDDPRMPTISGMRRRGITPAALRDFSERIGVTKKDNMIEMALFENCVREDLDKTTRRVMAVLKPLKVVIENYPEDKVDEVEAPYHPQDPSMGSRRIPFSRELWVEQDDFQENPEPKFFRLGPGREVRLRYGYLFKCTSFKKDANGKVVEIRGEIDHATLGANPADGRKVKGTIHWVSARHAVRAETRLYDRLFNAAAPGAGDRDYKDDLNPDSLVVLRETYAERSLGSAQPGDKFQFERTAYFTVDADSRAGAPVFNRTVTLRDSSKK